MTTSPMIITFVILLITIILFIHGKLRPDFVSVASLLALTILGILTPEEALSGFSNSVVLMIAGLFIVGAGIFDTGLEAITEGKRLRELGNTEVITDGNTLRKYLQSLDNVLNLQGRRTPKNWRGKTPRELGFEIIKDTNVKD